MGKIIILISVFAVVSFAQSLLPVYQGKVEPKFELVWEINDQTDTGDHLIGQPFHPYLNEDGDTFIYDYKEQIFFKFDKKGKFIKTIGKKGAGPGEYQSVYKVHHLNNNIYGYDYSKMAMIVLDEDGKYIKSYKSDDYISDYTPLKKGGYIAVMQDEDFDNNKGGTLIKICKLSSELKLIKVIDSIRVKLDHYVNIDGNFANIPVPYCGYLFYQVIEDKIITARSTDFKVNVFDLDGTKINSFKVTSEKKRISERDKDNHFSRLSFNGKQKLPKWIYEKTVFPDYKSYFETITTNIANLIEIIMHPDKNGNRLIEIYDLKGNKIAIDKKDSLLFADKKFLSDNNYLVVIEKDDEELPIIRKYKIIL